MTNTNPPEERDETTIATDQLHDWIKTSLAELLGFVEQREAGLLSLETIDELPIEDDFAAKRHAVCCRHGRATRRVPCRNRNFPGCPFRDKILDGIRVAAARNRYPKIYR
jgi:hypothetical protein